MHIKKRQSLESRRKIKQQMLKRSGAQLPARSLAGSSSGSLFPLILQGKSKLPLAADEAEMGVSGGIFIRIYPRLLGRPAAYLQGFNGNHSTFLRSRGRRHPGWRRDGFQEMDAFSWSLSLYLLHFQAVWMAFCCDSPEDTCWLTWTDPSSTLTPSSPAQPRVRQRRPKAVWRERRSALQNLRFHSNGGGQR